jgi:hypothetical protein
MRFVYPIATATDAEPTVESCSQPASITVPVNAPSTLSTYARATVEAGTPQDSSIP